MLFGLRAVTVCLGGHLKTGHRSTLQKRHHGFIPVSIRHCSDDRNPDIVTGGKSSALARIDPGLLTKIGPPTFRLIDRNKVRHGESEGASRAVVCDLGSGFAIRCARLSEA